MLLENHHQLRQTIFEFYDLSEQHTIIKGFVTHFLSFILIRNRIKYKKHLWTALLHIF